MAQWQGLMTYQPQVPVGENTTRRPLIRTILLWALAATGFCAAALVLGLIVNDAVGTTAMVLAAVTASLAIGIVVPTFLWVDRLEAEPPRLLWFAFLWGGLVSTLGALLINELGMLVAVDSGLTTDPTAFAAVLVAPLSEEAMKGLGVLLIFLAARREFNGVTDGIVYAGLVAAGFAFVENILYLGRAFTEMGTPGLVGLFIVRVLFTPFAHPMFTVCTGIAVGMIAHRRRRRSGWVLLLGFALAVLLHALWNYGAVMAAQTSPLGHVAVQLPLFGAFVGMLLWARKREARLLRTALHGYAAHGWFTPAEVEMIADPSERRRARAWAAGVGGRRARRAMLAFQDESGELAMVRQHLDRSLPGADRVEWQTRERTLLEAITGHRRVFVPDL